MDTTCDLPIVKLSGGNVKSPFVSCTHGMLSTGANISGKLDVSFSTLRLGDISYELSGIVPDATDIILKKCFRLCAVRGTVVALQLVEGCHKRNLTQPNQD